MPCEDRDTWGDTWGEHSLTTGPMQPQPWDAEAQWSPPEAGKDFTQRGSVALLATFTLDFRLPEL